MSSIETALEDNRRLRRVMRDVAALSALPAAWIGFAPEKIARALADVLLNTVSLELVYIRWAGREEERPVEILRSKRHADTARLDEIRTTLSPLLGPNRAEPTATTPDPFGAGTLRSSGYRLLVVDDNEDAASALATLLRLQGHCVRVVHDGPSTLEAMKVFRPALVFLDIGMPGMDGYEVARRIRNADEPHPQRHAAAVSTPGIAPVAPGGN